jgi:hypothetical protein
MIEGISLSGCTLWPGEHLIFFRLADDFSIQFFKDTTILGIFSQNNHIHLTCVCLVR